MRRLYGSLVVLICALVVLGVGSVLPRLVFAGEGVGAYSGEKEAFAEFVLVYDLELKEWPFPVDPTVARRVTRVSGTHDADSPCKAPKEGAPAGFAGDYRAEVVHYGPFFVPTGKNIFNCDIASTYFFLLPREGPGVLLDVLGVAVLFGALGLMVGTLVVPTFLAIGGGILMFGSPERNHRVVGLAAGLLGFALAAVVFLAIATTVI